MNGDRIFETSSQEDMHKFVAEERREFPECCLGIYFIKEGARTSTFINPHLLEDFEIDDFEGKLDFLDEESPKLSSEITPELILELPKLPYNSEDILRLYEDFRDEVLSSSIIDVDDDIAMFDAFWDWFPEHKEILDN